MADPIQDTVDLLYIALFGVLAFLAYKAYQFLTNKGGTNCGPNGGQKCCDTSQVNTDACVGADGNPCGTWEFWTATTCYQGTPAVTTEQLNQARQSSSVAGGIGSIFTGPFTGSTDVPVAPVPGLPAGYDPTTGTIASGASGIPTASSGQAPSSPVPICTDVLTGNTYPC